jgi:hypothetical protein
MVKIAISLWGLALVCSVGVNAWVMERDTVISRITIAHRDRLLPQEFHEMVDYTEKAKQKINRYRLLDSYPDIVTARAESTSQSNALPAQD